MADQYQRIGETMLVQLLELCRYKARADKLELSRSDKIAIRLSWKRFIVGDPAKRGLEMFLRMFKDHPETKKVFTFVSDTSAGKMAESSRLLFHTARVVKYICTVVDNLDSLETVVPILKQLGGRHGEKGYNIPPNYFPFLGVAMRALMKEAIPQFNEKTEQLWKTLFEDFIVKQITDGQKQYGTK